MLKKLLKYDFKSILKYWWIAALSSFVLSFVGGVCIAVLDTDRDFPAIIDVVITLGLILVILSFVVFTILSVIFIYTRFYKNFFTDEGYLTFTLPVKRSQLLNSKLISSVVTLCFTSIVCIINVCVMICIGFSDKIFTKAFWQEVSHVIHLITAELGGYLAVYSLEIIIGMILVVISSTLFVFCCISFASIIAKKAKVLTAIAIYYVANGALSFVVQIFTMFVSTSLGSWLGKLPEGHLYGMIALIGLGLICCFGMFCALLYTLQYWMIDRKLNLN